MTEAEIAEALEVGGGAIEGLPVGGIGALVGGLAGAAGGLGLDWAFDPRRRKGDNPAPGEPPQR